MTMQVNIDEAKTRLWRPLPRAPQARTRGSLCGKIRIVPDFDETADEIVDMFHGEADAR